MSESAELTRAAEILTERAKAHDETQHALDRAEAEYGRLSILELADQHPGFRAFSFSVEAEYDDEGGYFDVAHIVVEVDPAAPGQTDAYEQYGDPDDLILDFNLSPRALNVLCGDAVGRHEGATSIERLRLIYLG